MEVNKLGILTLNDTSAKIYNLIFISRSMKAECRFCYFTFPDYPHTDAFYRDKLNLPRYLTCF